MSDPVPRLRRILNLIPLLRQRPGISIQELREELGASRKEILSDLNRIFLCGVPPYLPHDYILVVNEDDCVRIDFADHFARPVRLTLREALALKLAVETLQAPAGEMAHGARALLSVVNEQLRRNADDADFNFSHASRQIEVPASTAFSKKLAELRELVESQREIEITYYAISSDNVSKRWIRPYALVDQGGNYYLISYCLKSQDLRSFRADRIRAILDKEGPHFDLPENFESILDSHHIGPKQTELVVKARFHASISRWICEDYAEETFDVQEDGSLIVQFKTNSVSWVAQKLLGYGELVEVLEPESVRKEITRKLREIAESAAA